MKGPRGVVTGLGVVCSIGEDKRSFWEALSSGRCGIGEVDLFDVSACRSRIGAQARGMDFAARSLERRPERLGRCALLGMWAADEALREARLLERGLSPRRVAVVLGAGAAGAREAEQYRRQLHMNKDRARPSLLMPFPACNLSDVLANRYGFLGPRFTIATACSSSATAIGYALDLIRAGKADAVIAGGAESLSELTFFGFNALRSVDRETCRPFDRGREGMVLGEGAAIFVIEPEEAARADGVEVQGAVLGYGVCAEAHHMTSPDPDGSGQARSMLAAIHDAGLDAGDVDYINAHGTGTPINDRTESLAIRNVFGKRAFDVPVSSTKSALGHCLGAAGALEAAATLLAVRHGVIPPTLHYREPDPECDLDYTPNAARPARIRAALSNSFAFGGNNTTLAIGSLDC